MSQDIWKDVLLLIISIGSVAIGLGSFGGAIYFDIKAHNFKDPPLKLILAAAVCLYVGIIGSLVGPLICLYMLK